MQNPLVLENNIQRAELALVAQQDRLTQHLQAARVRAKRIALPPLALAAAGVGVGWMFVRSRRPAVATRPRTSARTAALVAPLLARVLTPTLGREMATLVASVAVPYAVSAGPAQPQTAIQVLLDEYLGHWFEVARLPSRADRHCASDVSTRYEPLGPDRIAVINRCRQRNGELKEVRGIARVVRGSGNARLKVSFAPALLRFLPWVWADYWIIDVAPDYSAAVVGTPQRDRLWLLGRHPRMERSTMERLIARAAAQGYDVSQLQPTPQRTI